MDSQDVQKAKKEIKLPQLSLDEKIHIIANYIVDRLIEEKEKGTIKLETEI